MTVGDKKHDWEKKITAIQDLTRQWRQLVNIKIILFGHLFNI